jgi:hypothetical protein
MSTLAAIKDQFRTCSDEDVVRLKTAILSFLGSSDPDSAVGLSLWPYTQIVEVVWRDGSKRDWVGICAKTSEISQSRKGCACGKCPWTTGLGGQTGPKPSMVYFVV